MRRAVALGPILLACLASAAVAQSRPYTEGNVLSVSYLRIKPGMFDKYMQYLDTDYKTLLEAQKKQGLVLDYGVYTSPQQDEKDWNMVLTVTYRNMAALDGLRDKVQPLVKTTLNKTPEQSAQESIERGAMRDAVGSRLLRQLILK
jgi:hypothetical protein